MKKFIFCCLFLSACTFHKGNFTILSNKPINLKNVINENTVTESVFGVDEFYIIGGIQVGSTNPKFNTALNNALEKGNGNVMLNVKLKQYFGIIPPIYANSGWKVNGYIVKMKNNYYK